MERRIFEIWLSLACTPDAPTFHNLAMTYTNAYEVYSAPEREIRMVVGKGMSDCSKLFNKDLSRAEEIYKWCVSKNVGMLSYFDEEYPTSLIEIPNAPVMLYYRGKLPNFHRSFRCSIVGTRSLSDYGRINAFRLGYDMAMAGATVVSGMAIGIDSVAMAGALAAGGKTIAVLGSGIDVCYPAQHQRLAREIVKEGCVLTECPPGTRPEKINFPRRNRIISGLSRATVVVEGREKSGSLITARHARMQGRDVFAFPGNVGNEGSQVTNLLIKNGANLCTGADDIVRFYEKEPGTGLNPFKLPVKRNVNMNAVLTEYQVCCVTPSDDIFRPPYNRRSQSQQSASPVTETRTEPQVTLDVDTHQQASQTGSQAEPVQQESSLPLIDKEALRIYKKIPMDVDCSVEDLVDEKADLRSVMKTLLKLEMARVIVILPGDRIKRILK